MSPAKYPIRNKTEEPQAAPTGTDRLSFSKLDRLKSKKSIDALFKSGASLRSQFLFLKYLSTDRGHCQVLIAVPKKFHKKAVTRNLLKRRMREAYRLNKSLLADQSQDLALIYQSKEVLGFHEIQEKLINLLVRLGRKTSPGHVEHESKKFSSNE